MKSLNSYLKVLIEAEIKQSPLENLKSEIVSIYSNNPKLSLRELFSHLRAANVNMSYFEDALSSLLSSYIQGVGKHNQVADSDFDPTQLKMGIDVEHEHTNDSTIVKSIAKDHLAEIPDYYTRLKKMEDEGKASLKSK